MTFLFLAYGAYETSRLRSDICAVSKDCVFVQLKYLSQSVFALFPRLFSRISDSSVFPATTQAGPDVCLRGKCSVASLVVLGFDTLLGRHKVIIRLFRSSLREHHRVSKEISLKKTRPTSRTPAFTGSIIKSLPKYDRREALFAMRVSPAGTIFTHQLFPRDGQMSIELHYRH